MTAVPHRFGVSTHLFHGDRLTRDHIQAIAAARFDGVEIFATRTHFDYRDPDRVADLRGWLEEAGIHAWSMHAPICDGFTNGVWGRAYSNASANPVVRDEAVAETVASIGAARALGCTAVVLHLGIPRGQDIPPDDNDMRALSRSLEPIAAACTVAGVRLALEVIPNDLASPTALLGWLGGTLELGDASTCLDTGHAHLMGGAPEAAEALSGHIITTHIHDNRGASDDHLLPFDGTIDWPATLMMLSKIGYLGPLVFEVPDHGDALRTLRTLTGRKNRLQGILDDLAQPLAFED